MARGPTQSQLYAELEARFGRAIADSFAAAIDQLKGQAEIARAARAVEEGSIAAVMAALHLDQAVFAGTVANIEAAYAAAGAATALPALADAEGLKVVVRFDVRNPRAEEWLRAHSSTLITRITDDQREAVRIALEGGLIRGDNPTRTALDIVGRIDRSTGRRTGGILGLTSVQAQYVQNAREELASGDPKRLRAFLDRKLRDRRHDGQIQRAADAGKPLPEAVQARAIVAYEARMLKLRGDTIGRTETLTALRAAKHEAFAQVVEKGGFADSQVTRTWRTVGDHDVRHSHELMNGLRVKGMSQPFRSPSGALMMYPGDTSLGAGAEETVLCRCDALYRFGSGNGDKLS